MTRFVVYPINPASKTLCKSTKGVCNYFINGLPSDMTVKHCSLWSAIVKGNNGKYKRCQVCLDHETEVDPNDEVFKGDM